MSDPATLTQRSSRSSCATPSEPTASTRRASEARIRPSWYAAYLLDRLRERS